MSNQPVVKRYQHDPEGRNPSNKVTNEVHILTARNSSDHHFIVPKLGPFFMDSVKLSFKEANTGRAVNLVLGKDYYFGYKFASASKNTAKPLYGSIVFLNNNLAGTVSVTYQCLGGDWLIDPQALQKLLADRIHNPRITYWEQVVELPYAYPVINHNFNAKDLVGLGPVERALVRIEDAIRSKNGGTNTGTGSPNQPNTGISTEQISNIVNEQVQIAVQRVRQELLGSLGSNRPIRSNKVVVLDNGQVDLTRGNYFTWRIASTTARTLSITGNANENTDIVIELTYDAGAIVTWPRNFKFSQGHGPGLKIGKRYLLKALHASNGDWLVAVEEY